MEKPPTLSFRQRLYYFLEEPESPFALFVRFVIIFLILVSTAAILLQLFWPQVLSDMTRQVYLFEQAVLGVFTLELLLRFYATPSRTGFFKRAVNWVDILAVVPFYFGLNDAAILRVFRVLRIFKLINSVAILQRVKFFDFKNSIIRVVSPLIILFLFIKIFIWMLETQGLWFAETDFDTLFAIIGFALGVVLSQKIGRSYSKYLEVQNGMFSIHGKLMSLQGIINSMEPKAGDRLIYQWLRDFITHYHQERTGVMAHTRRINRDMYEAAARIGNTELIPFHRLAAMMAQLFEAAIMVQSKRTTRTPVAYNLLLQQTIIFYLILLVVFIPGAKGIVSVVFAGYLLYGMFQLTNDFDDVNGFDGDEITLITLNVERIKNYLAELEGLPANQSESHS